METTNDDTTRMDWILTIVFFVNMVLMIMYADEWFWVPMPFFLTYLVRALKSM